VPLPAGASGLPALGGWTNRSTPTATRFARAPIASRLAASSRWSSAWCERRSVVGRKKGPAVAARLGPRYLQRISEAAGSLRPEIGEAEVPLPTQDDASPTRSRARRKMPL